MKLTTKAVEANCQTLADYGCAKRNAKRRAKAFHLTLGEWVWLWLNSGHWHERGNQGHEYCMSRRNDAGAYEVGNVFFQTNTQNIQQGNAGRKANYKMAACPSCGGNYKSNALHQHVKKCKSQSAAGLSLPDLYLP